MFFFLSILRVLIRDNQLASSPSALGVVNNELLIDLILLLFQGPSLRQVEVGQSLSGQ